MEVISLELKRPYSAFGGPILRIPYAGQLATIRLVVGKRDSAQKQGNRSNYSQLHSSPPETMRTQRGLHGYPAGTVFGDGKDSINSHLADDGPRLVQLFEGL